MNPFSRNAKTGIDLVNSECELEIGGAGGLPSSLD